MPQSGFYRSLPNILTFSRLLAAPVIAWLILSPKFSWAFFIFLITCTTDWLDGSLARRWKVESTLGQLLDPLADKVFIAFVYGSLWWIGSIPWWAFGLVFLRDTLILAIGISVLVFKLPVNLFPIWISKINTSLQMILALLILCPYAIFLLPSSLMTTIEFLLLQAVVLTTIWSGWAYGKLLFQQLSKPRSHPLTKELEGAG